MKSLVISVIFAVGLVACNDNTVAPTPGTRWDYYIDSGSGDDNNDGMRKSSPWQTLDMLSSTIFEPGDDIYFKRGGSYKGSVSTNGNGTALNLITISAYGTGAAPFSVTDLPEGKDLVLRVFIDKYVVEVFANDRQAVYATHVDCGEQTGLLSFSVGGLMVFQQLEMWHIKPTNHSFPDAQRTLIWELNAK